jgi:hypothetical protein
MEMMGLQHWTEIQMASGEPRSTLTSSCNTLVEPRPSRLSDASSGAIRYLTASWL